MTVIIVLSVISNILYLCMKCNEHIEFAIFFTLFQVYRVAKIVGQTRVVAKDENAVHYSIPVAYPLRFRVLSKTSWKDMGG